MPDDNNKSCRPSENRKALACAIRTRNSKSHFEPSSRDYANAITSVQKDSLIMDQEIRIRKLTPKECWRLMGFTDQDHDAAENAGVSNTQRYKQAGNSIPVNMLEAIFGQMFEGKEEHWKRYLEKEQYYTGEKFR